MIRHWLGLLCTFLAQKLPLKISYILASVVGFLIYIFWWGGRKRLKENLAQVMETNNRWRISRTARRSMQNFCRYCVELLRLPLLNNEEINKRVIIQGWDNLEKALSLGNGVILVTLHMGNWELGGATLASRRYPINVIADAFKSFGLNQLIQRVRTSKGMKIIFSKKENVAKMITVLRRGEILGLLIDRPGSNKGVVVRFCNKIIRVPAGPAVLALKTGAPVITADMHRLNNSTYVAHISRPIIIKNSGVFKKDIQELTQMIMNVLEKAVKEHPDQWYIFRRLWI